MVLIELFKELSTPVVEVKSENDEGCGLLSLGHSITLSPKEIAELCLYKRPSEVIKMEVNGDSEVTETNDIHPFHQLSSIIKVRQPNHYIYKIDLFRQLCHFCSLIFSVLKHVVFNLNILNSNICMLAQVFLLSIILYITDKVSMYLSV